MLEKDLEYRTMSFSVLRKTVLTFQLFETVSQIAKLSSKERYSLGFYLQTGVLKKLKHKLVLYFSTLLPNKLALCSFLYLSDTDLLSSVNCCILHAFDSVVNKNTCHINTRNMSDMFSFF